MLVGVCKDFLIPLGDQFPIPFMEGSQIGSAGLRMQSGLFFEERNFNKKPAIIIKDSVLQAGNRNHGAIRHLAGDSCSRVDGVCPVRVPVPEIQEEIWILLKSRAWIFDVSLQLSNIFDV